MLVIKSSIRDGDIKILMDNITKVREISIQILIDVEIIKFFVSNGISVEGVLPWLP